MTDDILNGAVAQIANTVKKDDPLVDKVVVSFLCQSLSSL